MCLSRSCTHACAGPLPRLLPPFFETSSPMLFLLNLEPATIQDDRRVSGITLSSFTLNTAPSHSPKSIEDVPISCLGWRSRLMNSSSTIQAATLTFRHFLSGSLQSVSYSQKRSFTNCPTSFRVTNSLSDSRFNQLEFQQSTDLRIISTAPI